ncbi:Histidinol dehydrogenase [Gammaproteobacteria bacterium]
MVYDGHRVSGGGGCNTDHSILTFKYYGNILMKINRFNLAQMSTQEVATLLRRSETDILAFQGTVQPIIEDIRNRGDKALIAHTARLDGAKLADDAIKVTEKEFLVAEKALSSDIKEVIVRSANNIRKFHEAQMPQEMWFHEIEPGMLAGEKSTPIPSVGLYVPRGKGSFPSVMLMLCIPAMVAKVPNVLACTPPTPAGNADDASLFAAKICGVENVYKMGGAQAIAAFAYGTETVPAVRKILGPGNSYVSAAKRILFGQVDVGTPAGPSESIILCDRTTDPRLAAIDLLIEAEHGPDSCALLVTSSVEVADQVEKYLPELISAFPPERQNFCQQVLSGYGGIVIAADDDAAIGFVNDFAPEHLEVLVEEPFAALQKIVNAGEILLGKYSPITIGNFSLGVNAILPTGGFAKTFSCVTVHDFLKRSSIGYLTKEGYARIAGTAQRFAEYEGFVAHAAAIANRNF